jgi:hypothetical protein
VRRATPAIVPDPRPGPGEPFSLPGSGAGPRRGGPDIIEEVTITPRVVPLGTWAEGVAFDGIGSVWVAESGQRTIAEVDPGSGRVLRRVKVGRLPVGMASSGNGAVYAFVNTDKLIWEQSTNTGRGRTLVTLRECPEALAHSGSVLWALTSPDCSSATSRVLRVDPQTGASAASRSLGEWGTAVAAFDGDAWVTHARGPAVSVVARDTLAVAKVTVQDASLWAIAATRRLVHVGGRLGEDNRQGLVATIDPETRQEIERQTVDERVQAIAADETHVVAIGETGRMWVFAAEGLHLLRVVTLASGPFKPRAALILNDLLIVTDQQNAGDNGALMILEGWRGAGDPVAPAAPPVRITVPDIARTPPGAPASDYDAARAPAAHPAAGIECGAPQTPSERAVCANPQLRDLDAKVSEGVWLALQNIVSDAVGGTPADQRALVVTHQTWKRERDRCGDDPVCLRASYRARLKVLDELNQPE